MEQKYNGSLRFINYQVNDVQFHLNEDFKEQSVSLDFDIERSVKYLENEDNTMLITLIVSIFNDAINKNYPFSMSVNLTGIFELDGIDIDKREIYAEVNAVAILFPYIRALVSNFTANANVAPLILPTVNVMKMLTDKNNTMN